MIFGKPANYCNLGKKSRLAILFSLLLHSLSILHPLWESQEGLSSSSWLVKVLDFEYFWSSIQFCYCVFQWLISSTEIYLILLLQSFPNSDKGQGKYWKLYLGEFVLAGEGNLRRGWFRQSELFSKLKTGFCEYWTPIKIKINILTV